MGKITYKKGGAAVSKVDKADLEKVISDAKALGKNYYTAESWAVVETALAKAETVRADDAATQTAVDDAQ